MRKTVNKKDLKNMVGGVIVGGVIVGGCIMGVNNHKPVSYDVNATYDTVANHHKIFIEVDGTNAYIRRCATDLSSKLNQAQLGSYDIIHISEDGEWTILYYKGAKVY